jgi:hypothetical protein
MPARIPQASLFERHSVVTLLALAGITFAAIDVGLATN